jgi:hypothetical protein
VNKEVPSLFVALLAGIGMGVLLGKYLHHQAPTLAGAIVRRKLVNPAHRSFCVLDVERN